MGSTSPPPPGSGLQITSPDQWITSTKPDQNPVRTYYRRLAPRSRKTQKQLLNQCVSVLMGIPLSETEGLPEQFPWHTFRYQHLAGLQAALRDHIGESSKKKLAPDTVNRAITAVRGVLKQCKRLGLMTEKDYFNTIDLDPVVGSRLPGGRMLAMEEVDLLQKAAPEAAFAGPDAPIATRNTAVIALMAFTGFRVSEVASLMMSQYNCDQRTFTVVGKGNKERFVYVSDHLKEVLDQWLAVRGMQPGPFFCRSQKNGKLRPNEPVSASALYVVVKRLATKAGVTTLSPHDLRRTFISQLLHRGADIQVVSKLVGHNDINTTARYDRRGDGELKAAIDSFNLSEEEIQLRKERGLEYRRTQKGGYGRKKKFTPEG